MTALFYLAILLATPIYYWTVGMVVMSFGKPSARCCASYAALLGLLVQGFLGEFALMTGISVGYLTAALVALVATKAAFSPTILRAALVEYRPFLLYYLIAALAATTALFPIAGPWSGDWFENCRLEQAVASAVMTPDLIGRTPLFAAASWPIAKLTDDLCGLQITAALASAAAAMALRRVMQLLNQDKLVIDWSVLLLCLSCMFLQHSAFPWAKMLAAGCIFAALGEILRDPVGRTGLWLSSLWLAAAVAVHQASILFVLAIWSANRLLVAKPRLTWWLQRVAALAIAGALLAVPYEIWTASHFGWSEKVHRNPALYYRNAENTYAENTAGIMVNSLVPDPRFFASVWSDTGFPNSLPGLGMRVFFTALYYTTAAAGTLFLAFFPCLVSSGARSALVSAILGLGRRHTLVIIAVFAAILGNAVLAGYSSPVGTLQAGLTPLGLAIFLAAAAFACQASRSRLKTIVAVISLQTLPWFALQSGLLVAAASGANHEQSNGIWMKLIAWEPDFQLAIEHFHSTLALRIFPLQIVILPFAILAWWTSRPSLRHSASP